jgi:hypothetical protein
MALVETHAAFLQDFGITATVGGASVTGIFDDAYADPLNFSGSEPSLLCKSSDVSARAQGDAVVVNAVNYTITAIKPDGTGMTRLLLAEA